MYVKIIWLKAKIMRCVRVQEDYKFPIGWHYPVFLYYLSHQLQCVDSDSIACHFEKRRSNARYGGTDTNP